jgi:hypothetical protein
MPILPATLADITFRDGMGCDVPGANCEVVIKKPIPNIQYEVD